MAWNSRLSTSFLIFNVTTDRRKFGAKLGTFLHWPRFLSLALHLDLKYLWHVLFPAKGTSRCYTSVPVFVFFQNFSCHDRPLKHGSIWSRCVYSLLSHFLSKEKEYFIFKVFYFCQPWFNNRKLVFKLRNCLFLSHSLFLSTALAC